MFTHCQKRQQNNKNTYLICPSIKHAAF